VDVVRGEEPFDRAGFVASIELGKLGADGADPFAVPVGSRKRVDNGIADGCTHGLLAISSCSCHSSSTLGACFYQLGSSP